jgi:Fe-S oxidoreductase
MNPAVMALMLLAGFGVFAWSAARRWKLLRIGAPAARFDQLGERLRLTLRYAIGQARMPRYRGAGVAHIFIFAGFLVLLLRSLILWARGFVDRPSFGYWLFDNGTPLGNVYALLKDVFVVLVIVGVLVFVYYRVVKRLSRMTLSGEGLLILGIIFTMMVADLAYDGASINLAARARPVVTGESAADLDDLAPGRVIFDGWEPAGSVAAFACAGLSDPALRVVAHTGFWLHSGLVLLFLNLLPYSKHFHIITAVPNVFLQHLGPPGRLPPITDLEGKVEREETLGIARIEQFSWKSLLDMYTCTECGRCSDNCPATRTGKRLSPKHFMVDLRDHLYGRQQEFTAAGAAPAKIDVVGAVIAPEVVWACTSCRACEEECPVFITYVDKFIDLRRYLVQEKGEFPNDLQTAFRGLENAGNPWGLPAEDRLAWAAGLDVPLIADRPDVEYLWWVGCAAAYDDKAKRAARALAQLLNHAEVRYAVLGPEETCNGDPARRAGNEFLFQTLAQANVETLNRYQVKKILTMCPHCFNTLKHEYPDFGGHYEVVHHSVLLQDLVRQGRLRPTRSSGQRVVYHDSCYLGRYNDIYDAPRAVLAAVPGLQLLEAHDTRDRGMCCGAGGAQMFKEEEHGERRVNLLRTEQLLDAQPQAVASACPFCLRMVSDGLGMKDRDDVRPLDLAEILWQAVSADTLGGALANPPA